MLGDSWVDLGIPVAGEDHIRCFCYLGNGIVLAGTSSNRHWLRSTDYGKTWTDMGALPSGGTEVNTLVHAGSGVVVGGLSGNLVTDIVRSTDWGQTFNYVCDLRVQSDGIGGGTLCEGNVVLIGTCGTAFVGEAGFAWWSADGGQTWNAGGLACEALEASHAILHLGGDVAIVGCSNQKIRRVTGCAATGGWLDVTVGLGTIPGSFVDLGSGIVLAGMGNGTIWESTDIGQNWALKANLGVANIPGATFGHSLVFAGTANQGKVFRSLDKGSNWTDLGTIVSGETEVIALLYFESEDEYIVLAGTGLNAHIARASEAKPIPPPPPPPELLPPTDLLCEQKKNPTDVRDPQPEFSAVHRSL